MGAQLSGISGSELSRSPTAGQRDLQLQSLRDLMRMPDIFLTL